MRSCSRILAILTALFVVAGTAGCASAPKAKTEPPVPQTLVVDVHYATDRDIYEREPPEKRYGVMRGEMSYGVCRVAINPGKQEISSHRDPARWPSSDLKSKKRTTLSWVLRMDAADFDVNLSDRLLRSDEKSALIYIHGYAKKFSDAVQEFAAMTYELDYGGVPVIFSWPSKGSPTSYTSDRATQDWSEPHLRDFLQRLMKNRDLDTIHVIAHSLGNRIFANAFLDLLEKAERSEHWKFGEIILVAPDVDSDIFERDVVPALADDQSRVTLYVSAKDVVLRASQSLNRYPRIGSTKSGVLVFPAIETVDVTEASSVFEGHGYHLDSSEMLSDLHFLIVGRQGAAERPTLTTEVTEDGPYWKIKTGN